MALPTSVEYGQIKWRAISAAADGADADALPDAVPVTGRVTFKPSASPMLSAATVPPVTVFPVSVTYDLDANGVLRDSEGRDAISLVATDSAGLNPVNWTWLATYNLNDGLVMGSFSFSLPANSVVDLTTVTPVAESNGTPVIKGDKGDKGDGFVSRGPWADATAYALRDIVTNQGSVFECITAHTSAANAPTVATPTANWQLWAQKGDTGPQGQGVPTGGTTGQVVSHDGTTTVWVNSGDGVAANTIAKRNGDGSASFQEVFIAASSAAASAIRKDHADGLRRLARAYNTANKTFALADEGTHQDFDCAGTTALTATIPADATVNFPVGSWISLGVMNPTASLYLTIAPATGVTLRSAFGTGSVTVRTNYDVVRVRKLAADIWQIDGAVTASAGVANSVVRRDGSGNVEINSVAISAAATQAFHATRKDYVDAIGTNLDTANTVVRRDANADASFRYVSTSGTSPAAGHLTRRDYVDAADATKITNVAGTASSEKLTQAAYDALGAGVVADRIYFIVG